MSYKDLIEVECIDCHKVYTMLPGSKRKVLRKHGRIKCRNCCATKWTKQLITEEALKYAFRSKFRVGSVGAYERAVKTSILDEVCLHMESDLGGPFTKLIRKKGIYTLLSNGDVVYIGKSRSCIAVRLNSHYRDSNKDFDEVISYLIEGDSDINVVEIYLINLYKPKYNKGDIGASKLTFSISSIDDVIKEEIVIKL